MLQSHPESPLLTKSIERMHTFQRLKVVGTMGLTALMGLAPYASLYAQDVQRNIEVQQEARIDIDRLYEPLDPNNSNVAIVSVNGFGEFDARTLAKYQGPMAQKIMDGQIWSVQYNNAHLEPAAITNEIAELSKAYGVDTIVILGYSAGGIISTQVTNELLYDTDLEVPLIIAVSMPDGMKGLRALQLQEIEVASVIENIPGATHSTAVRYLGEMYFRRDRYDEGLPWERAVDAINTHNWVMDDLQKDTFPGTWLLIDQVNAVASADLEAEYEKMGSLEGKEPPVTVYLGTAAPGYDYVVNDKRSGEQVCKYAFQNEMHCFRYNVPGAVHTRPDLAHEAYMDTAEQISPLIQKAIEESRTGDVNYKSNLFGGR